MPSKHQPAKASLLRTAATAALLAALVVTPAFAADYLADGMKAMQAGDLRTAQIQLRNAVKANPKDAEANFRLAEVNLMLGDPSASEKNAISAQNLGYDQAKTAALAMKGYLIEGRYRDLLRDFPVGIGTTDAQVAVLSGRAQAQIGNGQPDAAASALAEARRLNPKAVEPLLIQSQVAINAGDLPQAMKYVNEALALAPNNAEALQRHSALLSDTGDRKAALAEADKAVAAAPGQYQFRLNRAAINLALGQDAAAKTDVDAVLAMMPTNAQGTYDRAVLLARANDFKAADTELQKLPDYIARNPAGLLVLAAVKQRIGQLEQALDAATRYVARMPNDPRGNMVLADIAMQARRYGKVVDALTPLVTAGTKDANVYDMRGRAYAFVGRTQDAVQDFQKALQIAPDNAAILGRLGSTMVALGGAEGGRQLLARAVKITPDDPQLWEVLTEANLTAGQLADARVSIARMQALGANPEAVANMTGLLKLSEYDLPGARDAFEAILKTNPASVAAQLNLARVDRLQGRNDDAVALYKGVLAKQPTQERAVTELVGLDVQMKKLDDARAVLERAHDAAPQNAQFMAKLAEAYVAQGEPEKALAMTMVDAANSDGTTSPPTAAANLPQFLIRAQAQLALKQFDQAAATYRQILAAVPDLTFARLQLTRVLVAEDKPREAETVINDGLEAHPDNVQLLQASLSLVEKTKGIDEAMARADELALRAPSAMTMHGDLLMDAKRFDDAAAVYGKRYQTGPSTVLATKLALAQSSGGHPDLAAQTLRGWVGKHPDDASAAISLADLDIEMRNLPEAKTLLEGVLKLQPANAAALNNLAWVDQQTNDPQARSLAERAYMLSPSTDTADTLGYILATENAGDKGVGLLRQATSQVPGNATMQYHLAFALKQAGQKDEAIQVLTPIATGNAMFRDKPAAQKLLADLTGKP